MWILLVIVAALSLGASGPAPGQTPPPSPEFKRPADALFADDFSSGELKGWRSDSLSSAWSIRDGMLRAELPNEKQAHSFLFAGDTTWTDYAVDLDVCGMRGADKGFGVRVLHQHGLGIDLRGGTYGDVMLYVNRFRVGSGKAKNENGSWNHMRAEMRGGRCRLLVNDHVVYDEATRFKPPAHGGIALAAYAGGLAECTVYYDNVVVTPLAAASKP